WSRLTFYLLDLTNERSATFPAQPAKPFASRLTTYCDEPDEMGLRLNRKGDEDAKSFRKNLDWPHYFCTGGHHFQALRNSSGNPAALWLACPIRSFRWVGGWHAWGRNSFQMGVSGGGCKPLVRLPGCRAFGLGEILFNYGDGAEAASAAPDQLLPLVTSQTESTLPRSIPARSPSAFGFSV